MPAARTTTTKLDPEVAVKAAAAVDASFDEFPTESVPPVADVAAANSSAIPNLARIVTKEMVKTIGTGQYAAAYIPWSKIAELLLENAPGWQPELIRAEDGGILHRAPVGAYILIRFRNLFTGLTTTEWVHALQDNRHKAIPFDKIDARDVSDATRRGFCLAAAATFSLGVEMWTRDPVESGYSRSLEDASTGETPVKAAVQPAAAGATAVTKEDFLKAAAEKGLTTFAAEALVEKLKGNFAGGVKALKAEDKDANWVKSFNEQHAPKSKEGENW